MWKQVANQSERQLGAYYFLWYTFFGETPEFLDRRKVELRNSVIHKGRLATKEESEEFGEYVFDYIRRSQERLHKAFGEPLGLHIMRMSRLFRLSSASVDKAMRNPPMLEHEGEMFFKAIGCDPMPSFLSMEEIESYWDCFNQEKAVGCPIEK